VEGEGFIPMVKPLLSQGMRKNWQKNLAHHFFRTRAMKLVIRDARVFIGNENDADVPSDSIFEKKLFHKYKRWQQVQSHFQKGLPISLAVLRDGFVGAVIKDRQSWLFVPFRLKEWVGTHCGLNYFKVDIFDRGHAGEITRYFVNVGNVADFLTYVLLLPCMGEENYISDSVSSWTMLGAEYERLSLEGNLQSVYDLPINLQEHQAHPVPVILLTI
jgi:hypothetical protein